MADERGNVAAPVAERRADPGTDLVSFMASHEVDGDRMTDEEIVSFSRLLLPAGAQTTYRGSSSLFWAMLHAPDQLAAIRADRAMVPRAVEEGLRWQPPLFATGRMATCPASLAGTEVPAGTSVSVLLGAANRDPERWDDPDRFDLDRRPRAHVAFGAGSHVCLGITMARMEIRVMVEEVLDRLPGLRLDPDVPCPEITGLGFRNPTTLPVVFDT